ncbi:MAG: hypothetical protein AB1414_13590 [bacterium]
MKKESNLNNLIKELIYKVKDKGLEEENLWEAVRGALSPKILISNLSEALRTTSEETESLLCELGLSDIVAQSKLEDVKDSISFEETKEIVLCEDRERLNPFPHLFSIESAPPLNSPLLIPKNLYSVVVELFQSSAEKTINDPLVKLYRQDVLKYYNEYMSLDAPKVERYILEHFKSGYPRYIINSGIGANEQFNHLVSYINNNNPNRKTTWLIINSPRQLSFLPQDSSVENTLFLEFSRSGKTEETIKIHEYTPRNASRIVFANSGPLREIGLRDNNLVLSLPDEVSGRFGRNKTPILLAPMHIAGMDTLSYWKEIETAIQYFDISNHFSLPMVLAKFLYLHQLLNKTNHIYLGCNDESLSFSADEFIQFWNEGVNKNGNDFLCSRYFGLPRDSHMNIEGILANYKTKIGFFLLRTSFYSENLPPMVLRKIDPINPAHAGLQYGDEEVILARANYTRFAELMPTLLISIPGGPTLSHSAILGQLWADTTFCYSIMKHIDPGSNPEVKSVRDRSAKLLAENL